MVTGLGGARGHALNSSELAWAARGELLVERRVRGIEGTARVLARAVATRRRPSIIAVGESLDDRDETLGGLLAAFAVAGPVAVALASLIGYTVAAAGLAPVEAMRRRAAEVSLSSEDQRLPLPAARDEVRRLGETLNDMLDRLRRSFERERRFVADASHELRTPVAVLRAELEGALRGGDYGPEVREALVAAFEECEHLAQLTEDLLVVARTADGGLPVCPEVLPAGAVLADVCERLSHRAAEHGREIRASAPGDPTVWADPLRLRQALGNLVDNALRHGEGEIVLTARSTGDGRTDLEVSDRGRGFGGDFTERAFERFTRGNDARTRAGTGLGLAIVRTIAEAHGGSASVVPGAGATVRLSLPGMPSNGSGDGE